MKIHIMSPDQVSPVREHVVCQVKQQEQFTARSARTLRNMQHALETLNRDIDQLTHSTVTLIAKSPGHMTEIIGTAIRCSFSTEAVFRTTVDLQQ